MLAVHFCALVPFAIKMYPLEAFLNLSSRHPKCPKGVLTFEEILTQNLTFIWSNSTTHLYKVVLVWNDVSG